MIEPDRLTELLDAATAEVPDRYRAAPLAGIERRARRRRTAKAVAVAVAVVAVLGGVAAIGPAVAWRAHRPSAGSDPSPAPASPAAAAQPWLSAMVSRDDRTITVYAGVTGCRELADARAQLTTPDAGRVVIAVYGRIVDAGDCLTAGVAQPFRVQLPTALASRTVSDAAGGARPVYHERNLPDLEASGWRPFHSAWAADNDSWHRGFNGPNGGISISLSAVPTAEAPNLGPVVTTVRLGAREGKVTGGEHVGWRVSWQVDGVTYGLRFDPAEGDSVTLAQFTHLLKSLKWS